MSVLLETSFGDLVIDLFTEQCPRASQNFLKLCKVKYYNNCLFYDVQKDYLAQTGDPLNKAGQGGTSIWGLLQGEPTNRFFPDEGLQRKEAAMIKLFSQPGVVAMANMGPDMNASAFFITLAPIDVEQNPLYKRHTVFGRVAEGLEVLAKINSAYVDQNGRPYQNIRIKHTLIIDDPFPDPAGLKEPSRSPSPVRVTKRDGFNHFDEEEVRLEDDVDINAMAAQKTEQQLQEEIKEHQTKTRAAVLEILEDLPDADVEPPKNVLFVCKLNPVTQEHDLELIFSRFGPIKSCEIIRDWKTGDSLQYAFIEYETEEACIEAYSRMDNVLIDERRIHVDFSQSVAKLWNTHRRRTLKEAAQKIIESDQREMRKLEKLQPLQSSSRRDQNRRKRSYSRDSSSSDDSRRKEHRHKKRKSRSRSKERKHRKDKKERKRSRSNDRYQNKR